MKGRTQKMRGNKENAAKEQSKWKALLEMNLYVRIYIDGYS